MSGLLILVIGFTGKGKSTFVKKSVEGKRQLIFDLNDEYKHLKYDNTLTQSRFIGKYEDFVKVASNKKNTHVIVEDATGFFRGRASSDTMQMLVKKRHTGNNYYFLFHGVNLVPKDIISLTNVIVLFKTNDILKDVQKKFPLIQKQFIELNNDSYPNFTPKIIKVQ